MKIYFAEPIDFDRGNYVELEFRALLVKELVRSGHTVFRPGAAFPGGCIENAQFIEDINRSAIDRCDVLVARLPRRVVSHGVPMEIEYATRQQGIPAMVSGVPGVSLAANPMVQCFGEFDSDGVVKAVDGCSTRVEIVKPLFHTGELRPKSYRGDAGIDLTTSERTTIQPGSWALVPTGNRIEIPHGLFAWITNRSSTIKNFGLMVIQGIIDEGYTGDYYASVWNLGSKAVTLEVGDRVAQVVFLPNALKGLTPIQVDEIEERDRGSNGFGSTG